MLASPLPCPTAVSPPPAPPCTGRGDTPPARLTLLDDGRWMAVLAVVMLHTAAPVVSGAAAHGSAAWLAADLYDSLCRWCVPVLVMITGAILLDPARDMQMRPFYRKRIGRIALPLVFWTLFYVVWRTLPWQTVAHSWRLADLWQAARAGPYYHLWYLYMLCGLYLFIPFIRMVYRQCSARQRAACVAGILGLAAAQSLYEYGFGKSSSIFLLWCLPYIGYFIAGRLIFTGRLRLRAPWFLFALMVALTAAGTYLLSGPGAFNGYLYGYFSVTVPLMSLAAFSLILRSRMPRAPALGGLTLGIYLIHPALLDLAQRAGAFTGGHGDIWRMPLTALLTFAASAALAWLMGRHRLVRRLI